MNSESHKIASEKASNFIRTHETGVNIRTRLSEQLAEQQHRTKQGDLSIIDIIISLGQRGIPFRGDWDKVKKAEDGNFAFFVNWKSKFDTELKEHGVMHLKMLNTHPQVFRMR
jgi:hypothetical protein